MKTFESSIVLATPPIKSARLVWNAADGFVRGFPLTVTNGASGTSTLATDAALPRGVLQLNVVLENAECCPRCMNVWSKGCDPTKLPGAYSAGSQNDTGPVPSCTPAEVAA